MACSACMVQAPIANATASRNLTTVGGTAAPLSSLWDGGRINFAPPVLATATAATTDWIRLVLGAKASTVVVRLI